MSDEDGQAIIEYLLMLMVSVSVVAGLATALRKIVLFLWQGMTCDIAAACPGCPVEPEIHNRLAPACRGQ